MGKIYSYGSSSFDSVQMKKWNGSTWVPANVYRWNGSAWVLVQGANEALRQYNATSFQTRNVDAGVKHYQKSIYSYHENECAPAYIGYYEEIARYGYAGFDFSTMKSELDGKFATKGTLSVSLDANNTQGMSLGVYLLYSSSSTSDYVRHLHSFPSKTGIGTITATALNIGEAMTTLSVSSRIPYALLFIPYNEDNMTSATFVRVTAVTLRCYYETD